MTYTTNRLAPLGLLAAVLLAAGCGQSSGATTSSSPISTALASATDAAGTLLCAPSQGQIDACAGLAAGAACTLTPALPLPDGSTTIPGTCRATLDGTTVACAPNPPAPPPWLVEACTGKASGDACTVAEPDGDTRDGTCVTARDGTTLVCGRSYTPPQAAIDACATLVVGATCTMPEGGDGDDHDGDGTETHTGICTNGPAGSGPLACTKPRHIRPSATEACAGLAAGAACTLGRHDELGGTCVTPAAGGDAVCVPACSDLGGRFSCRDGGHGGGIPGFPMPGPGGHHRHH